MLGAVIKTTLSIAIEKIRINLQEFMQRDLRSFLFDNGKYFMLQTDITIPKDVVQVIIANQFQLTKNAITFKEGTQIENNTVTRMRI